MRKVLLLARDGVLIERVKTSESEDSLLPFHLPQGLIPSLLTLKNEGFHFILVDHAVAVGKSRQTQDAYDSLTTAMRTLLASQGLSFEDELVCYHSFEADCLCRKPHLGLVRPLLTAGDIDWDHSAVVGGTSVDLQFAKNLGVRGVLIGQGDDALAWEELSQLLAATPRVARLSRRTQETVIELTVDLDDTGTDVSTGIPIFDHMLDQLAKHGGFRLWLRAQGDLKVDSHHTIEGVGLLLGQALARALGDKVGIARYGFYLPVNEASARVALDLDGRAYFVMKGELPRCDLGAFSTEMAALFFGAFAEGLKATLHIELSGENAHHMVEAAFRGLARSLRQAMVRTGSSELSST